MITNLHHRRTQNLGDLNCAPAIWFFGGSVTTGDLADPGPFDDVVIGGGGLTFTAFDPVFAALMPRIHGRIVLWAVGHNTHDSADLSRWPDWFRRATLIGVRDYGTPYPWVPCPSCMSPLFDLPYPVQHDAVLYAHHDRPLPLQGLPTLYNTCPTLGEALRFLASGAVVLTNTYHGAYWATLLGRPVVAFPFASRFHAFRHPPVLITPADWKAAARDAVRYPHALQQCRDANNLFYGQVRSHLDRGPRPPACWADLPTAREIADALA